MTYHLLRIYLLKGRRPRLLALLERLKDLRLLLPLLLELDTESRRRYFLCAGDRLDVTDGEDDIERRLRRLFRLLRPELSLLSLSL